ncbi:MAG TPA: hypothetical protein VNL16_06240 [Chloroflexota bacterium]|nr:hypothetical protein [Chloroflexota bacterium]
MAIRIEELTSNVTIQQGSPGPVQHASPVAESTVPTAEELPPLETVLHETTSPPIAVTTATSRDDQGASPSAVVDPEALADVIYRMMREDLAIGRERMGGGG